MRRISHHTLPAWFLGINVMLDLTPNYLGSSSWFTPVDKDIEKVKVGRGSCSVVLHSQKWRLKCSTQLRFAFCPRLPQSTGSVRASMASRSPTSPSLRVLQIGPSFRMSSRRIPLRTAKGGNHDRRFLTFFWWVLNRKRTPGFLRNVTV